MPSAWRTPSEAAGLSPTDSCLQGLKVFSDVPRPKVVTIIEATTGAIKKDEPADKFWCNCGPGDAGKEDETPSTAVTGPDEDEDPGTPRSQGSGSSTPSCVSEAGSIASARVPSPPPQLSQGQEPAPCTATAPWSPGWRPRTLTARPESMDVVQCLEPFARGGGCPTVRGLEEMGSGTSMPCYARFCIPASPVPSARGPHEGEQRDASRDFAAMVALVNGMVAGKGKGVSTGSPRELPPVARFPALAASPSDSQLARSFSCSQLGPKTAAPATRPQLASSWPGVRPQASPDARKHRELGCDVGRPSECKARPAQGRPASPPRAQQSPARRASSPLAPGPIARPTRLSTGDRARVSQTETPDALLKSRNASQHLVEVALGTPRSGPSAPWPRSTGSPMPRASGSFSARPDPARSSLGASPGRSGCSPGRMSVSVPTAPLGVRGSLPPRSSSPRFATQTRGAFGARDKSPALRAEEDARAASPGAQGSPALPRISSPSPVRGTSPRPVTPSKGRAPPIHRAPRPGGRRSITRSSGASAVTGRLGDGPAR